MPTQDIVDQAFALVPGGSFAQKLLGDLGQTAEARMAKAVKRARFAWLEEDVSEIKGEGRSAQGRGR